MIGLKSLMILFVLTRLLIKLVSLHYFVPIIFWKVLPFAG